MNNPKQWSMGDAFATFFKIGLFTIGGGYAMIPLIEKEVVEKKCWIDRDEFLDLMAVAQSAPGVFAVIKFLAKSRNLPRSSIEIS